MGRNATQGAMVEVLAPGLVLQQIDAIEQAAECLMKEVALLAEKIGPTLREDSKSDTAYPTSYPDTPCLPEDSSQAALVLSALHRTVTEAGRALEALRRRVQL